MNSLNKKQNKAILLVLIALLGMVAIPFIAAVSVIKPANIPSDDTVTLDQLDERVATNGINVTTASANVSLLSIEANLETEHWSAFVGNITLLTVLISSGGIGDSANIFNFIATASSLESIAATTTLTPNWANYKAVNKNVVDAALQLGPSSADSASNMYNNTAFTFGGVTLNTTYLFANSSIPNSNWANGIATTASSGTSYTANTGVENLIFLARVNGSKACNTWGNGAGGKTVETNGNCTGTASPSISAQYQMIIGVNVTNTTGDTEAGNLYTFFIINP